MLLIFDRLNTRMILAERAKSRKRIFRLFVGVSLGFALGTILGPMLVKGLAKAAYDSLHLFQ